jgi:8-oxo-dGTP pyrophosphatase MutT (NUDIX family)
MDYPVYRGGCGIIVSDKYTGEVLVGHRADGQGWGLPGGKPEGFELPVETASRELEEEFGIHVSCKELYLAGKIFAHASVKGVPSVVESTIFKLDVNKDTTKIVLSDEMTEYRWISLKSIPTLDKIFEPTLVALNMYGNLYWL